MKKYIGLIFVFTFISQSCLSETMKINSEALNRNIDIYITDYVNKIKETKKAEIFGYSPEGGIITADFDKEMNILYFKAYLFFETGKIKYECYCVEDDIKYFFKTTYRYNLPIYDENSEIISEETEEMIILKNRIYRFNSEENEYNLFENDRYLSLILEFIEIVK